MEQKDQGNTYFIYPQTNAKLRTSLTVVSVHQRLDKFSNVTTWCVVPQPQLKFEMELSGTRDKNNCDQINT